MINKPVLTVDFKGEDKETLREMQKLRDERKAIYIVVTDELEEDPKTCAGDK